MPILPVLDLMQGQIVRGVAGRRDDYQPIVSNLTSSAKPVDVALALHERFGFDEFYLADLDAIRDGVPNLDVYRQLQMEGFRIWVDAGIRSRSARSLKMLIIANVARVIIGLETIADPEDIGHIVRRLGVDRAVFSLDLKDGKALGAIERWHTSDPFGIARRAIESLGVRRLIVLDLARVGVGTGTGTEALCRRIKEVHPDVHLCAGGGVRGIDDVTRLMQLGVEHVLVASALHDGRIMPADVVKRAQS
ncbi:MAG TPA: HisA/HisF-related TIM barrel protein [Gemmataceae bacterium]|nr:HisA/HisF-related TIM barrel protein [Gemmataceae bacterium]